MDPQVVEMVKSLIGTTLTGGGVLGFYLLYRKFEADRAASLREDNKTLREENRELRDENRKLRDELKGDNP